LSKAAGYSAGSDQGSYQELAQRLGKRMQPLGKASPEMVLSENDGSPKIQWLINVNHIFSH
jgi:hypothetical protein